MRPVDIAVGIAVWLVVVFAVAYMVWPGIH